MPGPFASSWQRAQKSPVTSRVFREAYRYQDAALLQALAEKGIIVKKKDDLGPRPLTMIGACLT